MLAYLFNIEAMIDDATLLRKGVYHGGIPRRVGGAAGEGFSIPFLTREVEVGSRIDGRRGDGRWRATTSARQLRIRFVNECEGGPSNSR